MQENLTYNEIIEIKEYAQRLMHGKYYCGYNQADEEDYRRLMIDKIKESLEESLQMVGYDLMISEQSKTIYIRRQEDVNGLKTNLDLTTTKLVYILKRQFLVGLKKLETNKTVFYKWNDLLADLEPFLKKSNVKTQLIDSLWILKDLGLINVNTPKKEMKKHDVNGEIVIEIFPAIDCICDMDAIYVLEETLNDLVSGVKEIEEKGESDND
jgi:hypothetical protein